MASRLAKGTASQGMDLWYSAKSASVRSLLANTTSNSRPSRLSVSYTPASIGVNCRHGGHQCAEKYTPTVLPASASTVFTSMPSLDTRTSPNIAGAQVAMARG